MISGPNAGAEFALQRGSTYILGKDPNVCDIIFQDLSVSRQHARLSVDEENQIFIEDLNSRNGVLVNGELIAARSPISSQDLIALGTTSFLMIDREQIHETIISPHAALPVKAEEVEVPQEEEEEDVEEEVEDWKDMVIKTRHAIWGGVLCLALIGGIGGLMALFKTQTVIVKAPDVEEELKKATHGFDDIQYSYNPANGTVFLVGHVLTSVEKQELFYKVNNLPFVHGIEDNVVIDEYVWESMNALLMLNPDWVGVSLYAEKPGRFVLRGYLPKLDEAGKLTDYVNLNFPYLDRLDNQIVIESNLQTQIQSMLLEKGFSGVAFQLSNGDLVLSGRVDNTVSHAFTETAEQLKTIKGIRTIKNFVIFTTAASSRIDITAQYKVTGYSKKDDEDMFVVINGKILQKRGHCRWNGNHGDYAQSRVPRKRWIKI